MCRHDVCTYSQRTLVNAWKALGWMDDRTVPPNMRMVCTFPTPSNAPDDQDGTSRLTMPLQRCVTSCSVEEQRVRGAGNEAACY